MTAAWATCWTSASGKTISGAWPPSSRLRRLTWSAERLISSLPTSVEPVKLILRTAGCSKNASAIGRGSPITRLATPGGQPGIGQALEHQDQGQRRLVGRPAHDRAADGQRRRDLAAGQRGREVPGRDRADHAHRVLDRIMTLGDIRGRNDPTVGPLALLGEPLEGVGRVQHLHLGLGERLALLLRQGSGDPVGALAHQLGGLLQDLGTIVDRRRHATPGNARAAASIARSASSRPP